MRRFVFCIYVIVFSCGITKAQNRYVCFESDKNPKLKISVLFDAKLKAKFVKYSGQKDSIKLVYSKFEKAENPGGGIPHIYWAETYLEKLNGKVTGEYVFTNAGTYQLDVTYTRKKDKKEFYFHVSEENNPTDDFPYHPDPCF
jgi:hypothetical protein